jgi:hypothetical protein
MEDVAPLIIAGAAGAGVFLAKLMNAGGSSLTPLPGTLAQTVPGAVKPADPSKAIVTGTILAPVAGEVAATIETSDAAIAVSDGVAAVSIGTALAVVGVEIVAYEIWKPLAAGSGFAPAAVSSYSGFPHTLWISGKLGFRVDDNFLSKNVNGAILSVVADKLTASFPSGGSVKKYPYAGRTVIYFIPSNDVEAAAFNPAHYGSQPVAIADYGLPQLASQKQALLDRAIIRCTPNAFTCPSGSHVNPVQDMRSSYDASGLTGAIRVDDAIINGSEAVSQNTQANMRSFYPSGGKYFFKTISTPPGPQRIICANSCLDAGIWFMPNVPSEHKTSTDASGMGAFDFATMSTGYKLAIVGALALTLLYLKPMKAKRRV